MFLRVSKSVRGWLWPLAIALLILSASSRGKVAAPEITNVDKVAHFAVYGLLATLVCRQGAGWRNAAWSLLLVAAFGASDEWHQSFVPGRSADIADWIADIAGAATAIVLYVRWRRYRELLERPVRLGGRGAMPPPAGTDI